MAEKLIPPEHLQKKNWSAGAVGLGSTAGGDQLQLPRTFRVGGQFWRGTIDGVTGPMVNLVNI